MPSNTSTRGLGRRFAQLVNQSKGQVAWVGDPDGVTVSVPDTTNQVWIRLIQDSNKTYPAYNLTGTVWVYDDLVWVELRAVGSLRRGDYWIVSEYTFTP